MNTSYVILEDPEQCSTHVNCALRIQAPARSSERQATHFIMLIDASESMANENRLENVKHSTRLVLNFLGPNDRITLISFHDTSTVHCTAVPCSSENKAIIQTTLDNIRVNGCTNLSAGIMNVKSVLGGLSEADLALKTGVMVLTDGHANRGMHSSVIIMSMFKGLHEQFPAVSFSVVGYGTDHNAQLMKAIADYTQGAYSIVDNLEGAATVIGDTIGGLFSCFAQNVKLVCPVGSTIIWGAQQVFTEVAIGDVYDESELIVLFEIPKSALVKPIVLSGVSLQNLQPFAQNLTPIPWTAVIPGELAAFHDSIVLTRLRYKCSSLFRQISTINVAIPLSSLEFEEIKNDIKRFREAIFAEGYNGNPVADMLRSECKSLEAAMQIVQQSDGYQDRGFVARMVQHEAFTSLGRGASQSVEYEEDPEMAPPSQSPTRFPGVRRVGQLDPTHTLSPTTSRMARDITSLMASMSMGAGAAPAAEEDAIES